jgi:hypothetical protein
MVLFIYFREVCCTVKEAVDDIYDFVLNGRILWINLDLCELPRFLSNVEIAVTFVLCVRSLQCVTVYRSTYILPTLCFRLHSITAGKVTIFFFCSSTALYGPGPPRFVEVS